MHRKVGSIMNKIGVCGEKINYKSEESATRAAESMNKRTERRGYHKLEAYPCFYCEGWHIGREMTEEEMIKYIQEAESK